MAANQEDVVYQYTGDVSSLKQATEEALGLLNKYQSQIDRISADGGFGKNAKAVKSFQSQLKSTTSQFTSMQKQMQGLSDVKLFPSSSVTQQLQGSLESIHQVYGKLASSSALSTKEVQALASQVKSANTGLKSQSADITTLIQKEQQWQQTLANVYNKTTQFRNSLDSLKGKVSNAFDPLLTRLRQISAPFTGIVGKIQIFKDKAKESFGRVSQLASTVSAAFRRVSTSESGNTDSTNRLTAAHSRLRSVLSSTQESLKKETGAIDKEKNELKNKSEVLKKSERDHESLGKMLQQLGSSFASDTNKIKLFNTNINITNSISKLLKSTFGSLVGIPLSQWLASAAQQSINFTENLNLFKVAMGEAYDVGNKFINQMAEIYGMDPSNLMRYAGNFYQLSDAIGMPAESASGLTLSLVKMTNDLSSLFNVPIEKVFEDMSSGMQGMSRAVRKYGMDIRATTLQQTALTLGITDNVETMSEANRQGLRFITMLRQAKNASGDFARTIPSPANQLKIFKEQMTQLGRAIGDLFIRPLSTAIQYINGFVMALRMAISFIGSILGLVEDTTSGVSGSTDEVAESVEGIGTAAGGAAKKLKALLAPFDELNILSKQSDESGSDSGLGDLGILDPAIAAEIEAMELQLEDIRMKALEVRDALLKFFGFSVSDGFILSWDSSQLEKNLINKFPQWTRTIKAAFSNWTNIVSSFKKLFKALGGVVQSVWNKIADFLSRFINDNSVSTFIEHLSSRLDSFTNFVNKNRDAVADLVLTITALFIAFSSYSKISALTKPVVSFMKTCSKASTPISNVIGKVTLAVAAIALLYTNSERFASSFRDLVKSAITGVSSILVTLLDTIQSIWLSIKTLWNSSMQPMISELGNALAPVLDTVIALWEDLGSIVTGVLETISSIWTGTIQPVLSAFFEAISKLAQLFGTLWSEWVGPVLEHIGDTLATLWQSTLKPIIENIMGIIGGLAEIVLNLWSSVLAPIVNWLANVLGPTFVNVFNAIWDSVMSVVGSIGGILNGLLSIIRGVVDFIAGVFTGDWTRAWKGVKEVFQGIWSAIANAFSIPINAIISVINTLLGGLTGAINAVVRAVNSISISIPNWVPGLGGKRIGFNLKEVGAWRVPYLASGAVVTSPTLAMVGEGKYDEAVIPLGNSPQMKDLVNQIAEATRGHTNDTPVQVQVYIGNDQVAEYMYKANRYAKLQTNGGIQ